MSANWQRQYQRERGISSLPQLAAYVADMFELILEGIYDRMSALDDVVAQITTDVQALGTALTRLLADYEAAVANGNPVAVANAVDALKAQAAKLEAFSASVDQADPAPAAPAPAPSA